MAYTSSAFDRGHVTGASRSLAASVKDIEALLTGTKMFPKGDKREEFRAVLETALRKIGTRWYKRGFSRGHMESYKIYKETGSVPKTLRREISREFVVGRGKQKVVLASEIKKLK